MAADNAAITLTLPSKYARGNATAAAAASSPPPSVEWLTGTWTVTHSTLSMWRSARNVRITYAPLEPKTPGGGSARLDDLVEYEPASKPVGSALKSVAGIDTPADGGGGWDWRGKGMLFFVSSHWEVLGWGEHAAAGGRTERWAVTWFAPTLFTKEGVDIYSDSREGVSPALYEAIREALLRVEAKTLVDMVSRDLRPVEITLPWTEK